MEVTAKENRQKRMLLIAPLFFGYYKDIMLEAENIGYQVDYVCDAPSNSNISKAFGRLNKKFIRSAMKKYYFTQVLPQMEENRYDVVLLVAGMTFAFCSDMIKQIRMLQKNARFVMYQWDSEKNLPYSTEIHEYFDRIYTFDRYDCMNKDMYRFLPLFYTGIYEDIGKKDRGNQRYDCSYVGTAHPQKYRDINRMANALKDKMPEQFIYHYMPSRLKYIYHKITAVEYRKARYREFQTTKLSAVDMMQVFEQSKCVLDAPQAGQTGLTIRTIECIGAKRKLITTNADIVNYDFYRESNVLVFTGSINLTSPFFTEEYEELPENIYNKYSLRSWIRTLVEDS